MIFKMIKFFKLFVIPAAPSKLYDHPTSQLLVNIKLERRGRILLALISNDKAVSNEGIIIK